MTNTLSVKISYSGISVEPYNESSAFAVVPVDKSVIECTYPIEVDEASPASEWFAAEIAALKITACLSLLLNRSFPRKTEVIEHISWSGKEIDSPKYWLGVEGELNGLGFGHKAEGILLKRPQMEVWKKAVAELFGPNAPAFSSNWLMALSWIQKAYDSTSHYDTLIAAWVAFNALYQEQPERKAYKKYIEKEISREALELFYRSQRNYTNSLW